MQTTGCWKNTICLENCWSRGDNRIGVAMNGAIYHERQVNLSILKKYVFAPMGRFQLESIYLYFPPSSQLLYFSFFFIGLSLL